MDEVAMDLCHIQLIAATAGALKPNRVLELGFGSGLLTNEVMAALARFNIKADYELVDSWLDWDGKEPEHLDYYKKNYPFQFKITQSTEKDFIDQFRNSDMKPYDLIISDADHHHSHEWFMFVIQSMLADGGVAFFHDVSGPDFANLHANIEALQSIEYDEYDWKVFNKSTRIDERCERGLLMVLKP